MLTAGPLGFLIVWIVMLACVFGLAGRFIGVTLFFAATATLYVLLPVFFFPDDAELFEILVTTVVLGVLGFYVGLTGFSGFSERRVFVVPAAPTDWDQIARAAVILLTFSLLTLVVVRPGFVVELGTYEGRVNFQARYGPLVFLLNQAVICGSILVIWAFRRGHLMVAIAISVTQISWAVYSSEKISLLAVSASWLSILMISNWRHRVSKKTALLIIGILMPSSLLIMVFYGVLRSGVTDLDLAYDIFTSNISRLGVEGVHVGDFGGPYWVFTQHLRDRFLELTLGTTYFEQLQILIPRVLRGDFQDLTDAFSMKQYGADYLPGLGFGFSPWAEAYMNFRVVGFFIQGLMFGFLTRLLLRYSIKLVGLNEVAIFFQFILITLFERAHFIGQIKSTVVYCLPFLITWLALKALRRYGIRQMGERPGA